MKKSDEKTIFRICNAGSEKLLDIEEAEFKKPLKQTKKGWHIRNVKGRERLAIRGTKIVI